MDTTSNTKPVKTPLWDTLILGGIGGIWTGFLMGLFNTDRYTDTKEWMALLVVALISAFTYVPLYLMLMQKSRRFKIITLVSVFIVALVLRKIMHDTHWHLTLPLAYFK